MIAAGDGRAEEDEVIDENSFDRVKKAIEEHEKTITLSVGQLTTGVTVRQWTAVLMLSNVKSPSLYMQAAFRAQNQWSFEFGGEKQCKQNAYVFDFAPERTLLIYDEFANNLSSRTVSGGGTTEDRENNILKLLNFFPVIAEDSDGKMVELDVRQVLTIPKTIKAQEVVRRGFMSNFLFQNISGIFSSPEVRDILDKLKPVDPGKVVPRKKEEPIDTKGVQVGVDGNATVDPSIVIAETDARFGEKVYADIRERAETALDDYPSSLPNAVASAFKHNVLEPIRQLANDNKVTVAQAELVVNQNANVIAREVEIVKKQADIRQAEAEVELSRQVAAAHNDSQAVEAAKARFEATEREIRESLQHEIASTIEEKTKELTQKSTEEILKKAEEKKRYSVEDDIRSRLRGFARTIPSFLMAYGKSSTALSNFDQNIKDSVFEEVTGISLDQFRVLRDTYNFFDAVVFNESVQEFLRKKAELANYFDENQTDDIFDYIPPQNTHQIFTPKWVVKLMVDSLEEENPHLFTDKDKTFVDLYVKSGLYLTEIVKRLYTGLKDVIPEESNRLKHILEHQVYGFAPSEIIYNIARNFVFGSFTTINDSNLQCFDLTEIAKNGGNLDMKFDVVVGNPPYQEETESDSTRTMPIYNFFMELSYKVADRVCLISPARFLFNAGYTPKKWNQKMLNDEHFRVEYYELESSKIFPNTDIKGGVAVTYRDSKAIFGPIEIFTSFPELNSIVKKVSIKDKDSFSNIIYGQLIYQYTRKLTEDYPEIPDVIMQKGKYLFRTSAFEKFSVIFFDNKPNDGSDYIQILGLQNSKRVYKWVRRDYISVHDSFYKYKVFIPAANGSGALGEVLSTPIIGPPLIGTTQTFLTIGAFDTRFEANSVLKYVSSKFVRILLGILKVTQHNTSEKWKYVPLQDFKQQSDIDWTKSITEIDRQLYVKYGLDEKEIAFIEEKVKPME